MKRLILFLWMVLGISAFGINITNYPATNAFDGSMTFLLSKASAPTNFNIQADMIASTNWALSTFDPLGSASSATNGYPWTNIVVQQAVHATNADNVMSSTYVTTSPLTNHVNITNIDGPSVPYDNVFLNGIDMSGCTGSNNVGILYGSLDALTTGNDNIALGWNALSNIKSNSANANVAIGTRVLSGASSSQANTVMGTDAMQTSASVDGNSVYGYNGFAMMQLGNYNASLGLNNGISVQTGYYNVVLGGYAASTPTQMFNSIVIGANINPPAGNNVSNYMTIANLIVATNLNATNASYSSGVIGIGKSPSTSYRMTVDGVTRTDTLRCGVTTIEGIVSGSVGFSAITDGLLKLTDNNGFNTSGGILFGSAGNSGSTYILSTNWPALMVGGYSNRVAFRIQAGTNSSGSVKTADLDITGNLNVTNGVTLQVKPSFTTNFTCTTNIQTYLCNGTNQIVTLPNAAYVPNVIYRFTSSNGYGSYIVTNATGAQTVRDGASLSHKQVGIAPFSVFSDGAQWWLAAKDQSVQPNAQFSCSTNIPLTLANTAYPVTFNSTDFNNSQGIALALGTNGTHFSKMWITNSGQYEFTPSIVIGMGNVSHTVRYWFRSNDTNIPASTTPTKVGGNDVIVVTVPFVVNITTPTAIEIWAESDGVNDALTAGAASGNYPASPSVICPVKRISDTWP